MFASLQDKLDSAFKSIRGKGTLTEKDIDGAMRDVRTSLLEADVNFKVVKEFCNKVAERSKGADVMRSLTPGQQVVKIVHEELIAMMGGSSSELNLQVAPPFITMLVGLQGAGKTTSAGKLARYLRDTEKRKPLLVPADVYRPAAIEQLKTLGRSLSIPVFDSNSSMSPEDIVKAAVQECHNKQYDALVIDTAGRLQIDEELMDELIDVAEIVEPHEVLLVADAMTGQEAVNVAQGFDAALDVDGIVLTKLDGDARGGAALSMRSVIGKPIKFIGVGEKLDALEVFHPERMASRILGMGDVLTLIEKASKEFDMEESLKLQKKISKNQFTFEDFLSQLGMMKKMGDMSSMMSMIPGMGKMMDKVDPEDMEKQMKRTEAIILSMTAQERQDHALLNGSRRKRIAKGSGTTVQEVNQLVKQFMQMRKMMNQFSKMGMGKMMNMLGGKGGLGNLTGLLKR
jgi:signal recognition particle subunit SRP54